MGFANALIVGPQEEADQTVQLKHLHERRDETLSFEAALKAVAKLHSA